MPSRTLVAPFVIRTPVAWVERLEWQGSEAKGELVPLKNKIPILMLVQWPKLKPSLQRYTARLQRSAVRFNLGGRERLH